MTDFLDKTSQFIDSYAGAGLKIILVVLVGLVVNRLIRAHLTKGLVRSKIDPKLHRFIISCAKLVVWAIVIITAVDIAGIKPTSLVTLLGAAGLALSLALQNTLGDMISGLLLLLTHPFAIGDYVQIGDNEGTVRTIGLIYTTLLTFDNRETLIPNSDVASARIIDFSSENERRLELSFSIGYGDSIDKAREIILASAQASGFVRPDPAPRVVVAEHGESGIRLSARLWVSNADYWELKFYLLEQVKKQFDAAGITIPYKTLDLNLKGGCRAEQREEQQ